MIGALEPSSHDWLPTSAVIEGAHTEESRNGEPVDGERRRVLPPRNEHKRDAEADGDHERAEMEQSPEERPGQTVREQIRIGRRTEAARASQARTPARTGPDWPSR